MPHQSKRCSKQHLHQRLQHQHQQSNLEEAEKDRLHELTLFEEEARRQGFQFVAGVDEAGRGPLAGPVVAAACIIEPGCFIAGVNDSKKLTPTKRAQLYATLTSDSSVHYGVGIISPEEIDQINILQATIQAMLQAVQNLPISPDFLLVDAISLKYQQVPCEPIIKGDSKSYSIAAASIIAKETRDRLMEEYHQQWPQYSFDRHKGYGTKLHREAIATHGPCPIHRRTFEPIKSMV